MIKHSTAPFKLIIGIHKRPFPKKGIEDLIPNASQTVIKFLKNRSPKF